MHRDDEVELQEMENDEVGHQEMEEEEMEQVERGEKLDEFKKYLFVTSKAILCVLNKLVLSMHQERDQRPLFRQLITSSRYEYTHKILNEDPKHFRQIYRMYHNVFLKICNIIRERKPLQDTRFICIEEMLVVFLLTVGQNFKYYLVHKTFGQSHFTISQCFNKILRTLNKVAVD